MSIKNHRKPYWNWISPRNIDMNSYEINREVRAPCLPTKSSPIFKDFPWVLQRNLPVSVIFPRFPRDFPPSRPFFSGAHGILWLHSESLGCVQRRLTENHPQWLFCHGCRRGGHAGTVVFECFDPKNRWLGSLNVPRIWGSKAQKKHSCWRWNITNSRVIWRKKKRTFANPCNDGNRRPGCRW